MRLCWACAFNDKSPRLSCQRKAENIRPKITGGKHFSMERDLLVLELVLLNNAPVYHGLGGPRGDGSEGILIPSLLCTEHYLFPLHSWLKRIGE